MPKKYELVKDDICNKIERGFYKKGDMLPTEKELAQHYNVARVTVQKALQLLSVRDIIERIPGKGTILKKYPADFNSGTASDAYALVLADPSADMMSIIKGIQQVLQERGYNMIVQFTGKTAENEPDVIDKVVSDGVKGIIVYPYHSDKNISYYRKLSSRIPVVTVDKQVNNVMMSAVMSDNFSGIYTITEHLIQCGHKNIAFARFTYSASSLSDRYRGFCAAMEEYKLPVNEDYIFHIDNINVDRCESVLDSFFSKPQPELTAIVCESDELAMHLCIWLKNHGIRVPEDISVTGFDYSEICRAFSPKLTTVAQNFNLIGQYAAELLLELQNNKEQLSKIIYIPTRLIQGESVRKLNGGTKE